MALNMQGASSCASGSSCGSASWRLAAISWRRVLLQQDWGSLLSTIVVLVALGVAETLLGGPRSRPYSVYDATLSYPHGPSTIPYWAVIAASLAALLATVLLAELWLGRRVYDDISDAMAAALHFLIDGISAFLVTGLVTQVYKMVVGRLRPDFLDRCQPAIPSPLSITYGEPAADNPACTALASSELTDGHYSFPSGHTSTAFVFSVWTVGYTIWAFSCRPPRPSAASLWGMSLRQRLARELQTACGFSWIVALLVYAWGVGVSRITDFKHHPSDVVAGALLGTLFGAAFLIRAVGRLSGVVTAVKTEPYRGAATSLPETALLQQGGNRVRDSYHAVV